METSEEREKAMLQTERNVLGGERKNYRIVVRTLSYLRAYCSMSHNFETFHTSYEGLFLYLVCQMCQIFGIWHI